MALYYVHSLARARKSLVQSLMARIESEGKDKQFLIMMTNHVVLQQQEYQKMT